MRVAVAVAVAAVVVAAVVEEEEVVVAAVAAVAVEEVAAAATEPARRSVPAAHRWPFAVPAARLRDTRRPWELGMVALSEITAVAMASDRCRQHRLAGTGWADPLASVPELIPAVPCSIPTEVRAVQGAVRELCRSQFRRSAVAAPAGLAPNRLSASRRGRLAPVPADPSQRWRPECRAFRWETANSPSQLIS